MMRERSRKGPSRPVRAERAEDKKSPIIVISFLPSAILLSMGPYGPVFCRSLLSLC